MIESEDNMTKEESIYFANCLKNNYTINLNDMEEFCDTVIQALEDREHETVTEFADRCQECGAKYGKMLNQYKAFTEWVASEIFSENWEDNKDAFVEIACRKLEKLGIVRVKGDEWELVESQESEDMGEVSDGYHTFNQLYHQRAILFATIVNQNKDISWKSYKHSDGKYCFDRNREWFIVGIDTPDGSYTYHYSKEYWDYFDCKELDCGKEWDGHTEEDVTRLLSLSRK